jgi:hypothetical protein
MTDPAITCPHCRNEIKLTESLAAPLLAATREQYEAKLAAKETDVGKREAALHEQQGELAKAKQAVADEIAKGLEAGRAQVAADEAAKARRLVAQEIEQQGKALAEMNAVLKERDTKLAEAQKAQADLIKKERELDDAKREMDLTIQKQVQAELTGVREKAKKEAEDSLTLKVREKEETIASMQRQIEELKRKAEQGSQQLQGEAQELELEATLRQKFPFDLIEPVGKGELGGDLVQRVAEPSGMVCGTILWEAKRTKSWSDGWLAKLREDKRAAKADLAMIVSHALPKGLEHFDHMEGVWVAHPRCAVAVAVALRQSLIELAAARLAGEGQQTKMEMVYRYLTGPRFKHRVEAIVEQFTTMQQDLDREKKATVRLWAKREEQIRSVIEATAGMYGDLQGIAGRTFQEIDGLEVPLLEAPAVA